MSFGGFERGNAPAQPMAEINVTPLVARETPQPELHLGADKAARYEYVAAVLAAAQKAGLKQIGFVTEPPAAQGANR